MMRLGRRASLLVAFSLLVWTAPAYAEGVWVLWRHEVLGIVKDGHPLVNGGWAIEDTAETRAECERLLSNAVTKSEGVFAGQITNFFPDGLIYQQGRITGALNYKCFPDTIDPRGPKGK
jgi:hypothetical protein